MATSNRTIEILDLTTELSGDPVATLSLDYRTLSERAGVTWSEGRDDFDSYRAAAVRVPGADVRFGLIAYDHDPTQGVVVFADSSVGTEVTAALDALLAVLGVTEAKVVDRIDRADESGRGGPAGGTQVGAPQQGAERTVGSGGSALPTSLDASRFLARLEELWQRLRELLDPRVRH